MPQPLTRSPFMRQNNFQSLLAYEGKWQLLFIMAFQLYKSDSSASYLLLTSENLIIFRFSISFTSSLPSGSLINTEEKLNKSATYSDQLKKAGCIGLSLSFRTQGVALKNININIFMIKNFIICLYKIIKPTKNIYLQKIKNLIKLY